MPLLLNGNPNASIASLKAYLLLVAEQLFDFRLTTISYLTSSCSSYECWSCKTWNGSIRLCGDWCRIGGQCRRQPSYSPRSRRRNSCKAEVSIGRESVYSCHIRRGALIGGIGQIPERVTTAGYDSYPKAIPEVLGQDEGKTRLKRANRNNTTEMSIYKTMEYNGSLVLGRFIVGLLTIKSALKSSYLKSQSHSAK